MDLLKYTEDLAKRLTDLTNQATTLASKSGEISVALEHITEDTPIEPFYVRYYYTEEGKRSFIDIPTTAEETAIRLRVHKDAIGRQINSFVAKANEIIAQLKTLENNGKSEQ